MQIDYRVGSYRATGEHDPDLMRRAGWQWLPSYSEWRTSDIMRVIPLVTFCVGEAAKRVVPLVEQRRAAVAASIASTSNIIVPVGRPALAKGFDFRGYQKAAIKFSADRHKSLNGDVPRLGKMITGIGLVNYQPPGGVARVLVLCPANAKITWCERWAEWGTHPLDVDYCEGSVNPETPFLVCNWDILSRHYDYILQQPWDIVIGDELHRLGSFDANRTRLTFGTEAGSGGIVARKHWLGLSGNPLGTRPLNLWPIVRFMDPEGLGRDKWHFRKRFCGATRENDWNSLGASNEEELQFKLRTSIMVRREKFEVADELPANRTTVKLPKDGLSRLVRAERNAVQQNLADFEELVKEHTEANAAHLERVAKDVDVDEEPVDDIGKACQELTLAALPMMIDFIKEQRETENKVVIFCHHRAVALALRRAFPECAFVIGGLSTTKRENERKRFQEDPDCHEFIGNISACCENLELAAADVVVFCELVWQTWQLDQAEDRVWLPGKPTPIQIFRLVIEDSGSADMADLLELRQASIQRATVAKRMQGIMC